MIKRRELTDRMIATNLTIGQTQEQVEAFVKEALKQGLRGVCVFQNMVEVAVQTAGGALKVTTVTGYPSGIDVPETKIADSTLTLAMGTDEIDLGINLSAFKSGDWETLEREVRTVTKQAHEYGKKVYAVLGTFGLEEDEIRKLTASCVFWGIDGIKTTSGDRIIPRKTESKDVQMIQEELKGRLPVKAEGWIDTLQEALSLMEAGADLICSDRAFELLDEVEEMDE